MEEGTWRALEGLLTDVVAQAPLEHVNTLPTGMRVRRRAHPSRQPHLHHGHCSAGVVGRSLDLITTSEHPDRVTLVAVADYGHISHVALLSSTIRGRI